MIIPKTFLCRKVPVICSVMNWDGMYSLPITQKHWENPEITEQILDAIEAADLDVDQQDKLEEEFAKEIHLVKTKFFYEKDAGLQEEHAEQAIAILNSCETEIANGN